MELMKIYDNLVKARRPADFFGDVSEDNQKILYRAYTKKVHPDTVPNDQKYIAEQAMSLLNKLNTQAIEEYRAGLFAVTDTVDLYSKGTPLFEFELDGKTSSFMSIFLREKSAIFIRG